MITVLNVAEKPSVAREITRHLCRGQSRRINNPGMNCDEFECSFQGQPCRMLVTSVRGHMMSLEFPEAFSWGKCNELMLFSVPLNRSISNGCEGIGTALSNFARQSTHLVLWLDCDREGENIAYEVIEICCQNNRNLDLYRAHFSALSYSDITNAWNRLGRPNPNLSEAVMARQEIDLRIGAAFTRVLTNKLRNKFQVGKVVSYGPCQFPTLGLVVDRWESVLAHKPSPFWSLDLILEATDLLNKGLKLNWKRGNLFDHRLVLSLLQAAVYEQKGLSNASLSHRAQQSDRIVPNDNNNNNSSADGCDVSLKARVLSFSGRQVKKFPPLPMTTISLTSLASTHLRMQSANTMKVAEGLYQSGYISYPRTETNKYPPTLELAANLHALATEGAGSDWANFAHALLTKTGGRLVAMAGQADDEAHPPIHPLKTGASANLSHDEGRLLDLIIRHFVASVSPPAEGEQTRVTVSVGCEEFDASGLRVDDKSFLAIYPYEKWTGGSTIPSVAVGSELTVKSLHVSSGMTQAPSALSESELIHQMDRLGIGTDATMHDHIKTVQDRHYVELFNHQLRPTTLGLGLIRGVRSLQMAMDISKPTLRENMERMMLGICRGEQNKSDFLRSCLQEMSLIFSSLVQRIQDVVVVMEATGVPKMGAEFLTARILMQSASTCACGGDIDLRGTQSGSSFVCQVCHSALSAPKAEVTRKRNHRCPICGFGVVMIKSSKGSDYPICPKCFNDPPPGESGQFRCFQCKHPTCTLATGAQR